ncbi:hypothetical protein F0U61_31465 [Archangium violaceum]|uniref:hypothetical protein n=1 Tax=Archangium violaceum TaxID=83451 RepID=UPI002B2E0BC5|nr:hypothetical protein F0U61_31465 [Archangium violaceum]
MQLLLRILAILLVLMTGGVFQTLAFASDGAVACEDEEETGEQCADCALDCAMCLCCPLRAAPSLPMVDVPAPALLHEPVLSIIHASAPSGVSADIFQPPRA